VKERSCIAKAISRITRWNKQLLYYPRSETKEHFRDGRISYRRDEKKLISFCLWDIYQGGKLLYIQAIFVDPLYRGRGYARQVFDESIAKARQRGAEGGFLFTRAIEIAHLGEQYNFQKASFRSLPFAVQFRLLHERLSLKRIPTYVKHGIEIFSAATSSVFVSRGFSL